MVANIPELDIITLLQAFYVASAASILVVYFIPSLHSGFLDYGARDDHVSYVTRRDSMLRTLVDWISSLKVPHSYFTHFYIVSVGSSLFWLQQLACRGSLLRWIANHTSARTRSMSLPQVYLCWFLLFLQGSRRLYESLYLINPHVTLKKSPLAGEPNSQSNPNVTSSSRPQSTMWIGHYAIGLLFYLTTNVAIWIHGLPSILAADEKLFASPSSDLISKLLPSPFPFPFIPPALLLFLLLSIFLAASTLQHSIHAYLASLPRYTLPTGHAAFTHLISPHYTCECAIYLAFTLLAAPSQRQTTGTSSATVGAGANPTIAAALAFVAVNLGVSADGTRTWSLAKFTEQRSVVRSRWRMLPCVW